jgi:hypothetical protein
MLRFPALRLRGKAVTWRYQYDGGIAAQCRIPPSFGEARPSRAATAFAAGCGVTMEG